MKLPCLGVIVGVLLIGVPVLAQEGGADPKPEERLAAIEKEVGKAIQEWSAQQRAKAEKEAAEGKRVRAAVRMVPPIEDEIELFLDAAKDYEGTDDAVPFLLGFLRYGPAVDKDAAQEVIDILMADHLDSPMLTELADTLPRMKGLYPQDFIDRCLATLETRSKNPDVRGHAILARSGAVVGDETVSVGSPAYEKCRAELLEVAGTTKSESLRLRIEGILAGREKLGLGNVAPDIVGEDLEGVPFKLSDYRGKVVMLDFWGDW